MKIAFVGNYQYYCGSSNTLLSYVRAGKRLGYDIRASEFGYIDKTIRQLVPIANKSWDPDLLIIVYESYPFLSDNNLNEIRKRIPRSKIIIIDPDCKYLKPCVLENDSNHPTPHSYEYWTKLYDSLSDIILQPTLNKITKKKVHKFIYFGINIKDNYASIKKDFDFLYVGNNWFRWNDIYQFVNSISSIRSKLKRIAVMGRYWDEKVMKGYEKATYSNPEFLEKNNIEILTSAPYGEVESSISRGSISPILVRPVLNKLKLVTPRMLETFAANTVAIIPKYFTHSLDLYGKDAEKLFLSDHPNEDILKILKNYGKYSRIHKNIRNKLINKHSYEIRLKELMKFVRN